MKTYTFRIEEKTLKQLEIIADKEDRTISQLIRIAIKQFLKQINDKK